MAGKTEYKNQWQRENVDRINLTVPKGRKETIQSAAASQGQSVNAYINQAIDERMERDAQTAFDNQVAEELASELGVTADEIKRAEKFSEAIDVIEARFPGSTKPLLMNRDATSPQDSAQKPAEGADGGGATSIPSGTETPSEAAQSDGDAASADDVEAHKAAMREHAHGQTIPHDAIKWD